MQTAGKQVVLEFKRRRKSMFQNFIFSMVLLIASVCIFGLTDQFPTLLGIEHSQWTAIGASQFVSSIFFALMGFQLNRCPKCNLTIAAHSRSSYRKSGDHGHCPHCGIRLY